MKTFALLTCGPAAHLRHGHLRRTRGMWLPAAALALAGCATAAPLQHDATFLGPGPCREERVVTDYLTRFPGIRVVRSGGGDQIRIRGALQEPLYILDGLPLAPLPGGALPGAVNPCDIESVRVLSDPTDLTFYGARGANGVVLITTRRR